MADALKREVRVLESADAVASDSAREVVAELHKATRVRGRATWLLSGGSTPRRMYEVIAAHYADALDWSRVWVFWGDERFVPVTSPDSNFRMATDTLLSVVPVPLEQIYPIPTGLPDPDEAALAYEYTMAACFNHSAPEFDVVLLGVGTDGHTASLFPGSPAVREKTRWVVATEAPAEPTQRISVTFPVINDARSVHILATGGSKMAAVSRGFAHGVSVFDCPVRGVIPVRGTLTWWLDKDAGVGLN